MKEIEKKIQEVQDYFKEKILKWEFELEANQNTFTLVIEWKYYFTFYVKHWIESIEQWCEIWDKNTFLLNLSRKEESKFYKQFLEKWVIEDFYQKQKTKDKMDQYNKLKEELGL